MKKQKGITLVALIITIIIMLILVAVSVNFLVKSNLIGAAEKTANGFKNAQEKENSGAITINDKTYASVDDYVASIEEKHNWQYTNTTREAIRCTCEECKAFNDGDSEGRTIAIGAQIGEAETINSSVTVTAAETGYETDQTITANGIVRWVVLGYEDQNGNGTNETLLLTTDTVIGDDLYLEGVIAYNNAVDTEEKDGVITKVCKGLYGKNVRSMKIEDVNRAMGYDEEPKGMMVTPGSVSAIDTTRNKKLNELGDNWTWLLGYEGEKLYTPEHSEGMETGTDAEKAAAEASLGEYEINGYIYSSEEKEWSFPVVNNNISENIKSIVFGNSNELSYWLASRGLTTMSHDGNPAIHFGIGSVRWGVACSAMGYYKHSFATLGCSSAGFNALSGVDASGNYIVRPVISITLENIDVV